MYKEILIIIIVLGLIIGLDIITNNYTIYATDSLTNDLNMLKGYILNNEDENVDQKIDEVNRKWKEYNNVMSYYLEHDELEKMETELRKLEGGLEVDEYEHSIETLNSAIFILEHIQEKEQFSIRSIF